MLNNEFKVGSHILVHGNKGIVEEIFKTKECKFFYNGQECGVSCFSDNQITEMLKKGYTIEETGRTHTTFTVEMLEEDLIHTAYNHGHYGCLDEFEEYGTW